MQNKYYNINQFLPESFETTTILFFCFQLNVDMLMFLYIIYLVKLNLNKRCL